MRVFVAIDIPDEIKEEISRFYNKVRGVKGKFVEKENLHITLRFLGGLQPHVVKDVQKALSEIKFEKFKVSLKGLGHFNNRVLWIGVSVGFDNIVTLHNMIDDILLRRLKFPKDARFHPHVTILRIKNILSRDLYNEFLRKYQNEYFGEFIVEKFVLKQSILRPQGPLYLDVAEFSLK